MTRKLLSVFLGSALFVAAGASLLAHHAVSAEFDTSKPISFTGTVKQVDWGNPHIYTEIETKDAAGKTFVYKVEGGAPNSLYRQGWRKDTLKIGQTVTVTGVRAKNPASPNVGNASILTTEGKRVFSGAYQQ